MKAFTIANFLVTFFLAADFNELSEVISENNINDSSKLEETLIKILEYELIETGVDEFLASPNLKQTLLDFEKVSLLKIKISGNFKDICSRIYQHLADVCCKKAIIVYLINKDENKPLIYWKSRNIQNFIFLENLYEKSTDKDLKVYEFIVEFLSDELIKGNLGK